VVAVVSVVALLVPRAEAVMSLTMLLLEATVAAALHVLMLVLLYMLQPV
jgi:hypothetical protein